MRILIAPNFPFPYDQRMVRGLARGFQMLGHEARPLSSPPSELALVKICRAFNVDVVLQVNRLRPPSATLPPNVRHVAWFQDVFPETFDNADGAILENDIVYALGDAEALGLNIPLPCYLGSLLTGVDDAVFIAGEGTPRDRIDFSLCAFIPPPFQVHFSRATLKKDLAWYINLMAARIILFGRPFRLQPLPFTPLARIVPYSLMTSLRDVVTMMYHPLCGELDIHALTLAMNGIVAHYVGRRRPRPKEKPKPIGGITDLVFAPYRKAVERRPDGIDPLISYLVREYPRLLDREALIEAILSVSRAIELYGPGWESHEQFKPYHRGFLQTQEELASVYRRSCINLANNTHGLGLHSRTLECMAVGGFIFVHTSPHDSKPGGMHTSFEPGVHYGAYTPETIQDEAKRWLRDTARRRNAAIRAAGVIRQKHLWRHRAQQVLDDLRR